MSSFQPTLVGMNLPSGDVLHEDYLLEILMKALLVIAAVAMIGYFAIGTGLSAGAKIENRATQIDKILEEATK